MEDETAVPERDDEDESLLDLLKKRLTSRFCLVTIVLTFNVLFAVAMTLGPVWLKAWAGGFHHAVETASYSKVRYHLRMQPRKAFQPDSEGKYPLCLVSSRRYDTFPQPDDTDGTRTKIAGLLLDCGAIVSPVPYSDALHCAVHHNRPAVVNLLLRREGKRISQEQLNSALGDAVAGGYIEIAELLLNGGADVNGGGKFSPICAALTIDGYRVTYPPSSKEGIVKLLLAHGAKMNLCPLSGRSPLHMVALSATHLDIPLPSRLYLIEQMIEHGADVNATDDDGDTPLHLAAKQVVRWTLVATFQSSASRDAQYLNHERALMKLLIVHGAREDIKDRSGKTPADILAGR